MKHTVIGEPKIGLLRTVTANADDFCRNIRNVGNSTIHHGEVQGTSKCKGLIIKVGSAKKGYWKEKEY